LNGIIFYFFFALVDSLFERNINLERPEDPTFSEEPKEVLEVKIQNQTPDKNRHPADVAKNRK